MKRQTSGGPANHGTLSRAAVSKKRAAGIEPASSAWKAEVLPLNYARKRLSKLAGEGSGLHASATDFSIPLASTFRLELPPAA
jgi:hypothetical protein